MDSATCEDTPNCITSGGMSKAFCLVEPYKSEILPHWKFRSVAIATESTAVITSLFAAYKKQRDFVGMDMARKFLQMGYTRARRYANHASGQQI